MKIYSKNITATIVSTIKTINELKIQKPKKKCFRKFSINVKIVIACQNINCKYPTTTKLQSKSQT